MRRCGPVAAAPWPVRRWLARGRAEQARRELRRAAAELEACGAWGYRDARAAGAAPAGRPPASGGGAGRRRRATIAWPR